MILLYLKRRGIRFIMTFFTNIKNLGDLILEETLFEFENMPMITICVDKNFERYLCLCTDPLFTFTWIIAKIETDVLINLIKTEIDVCTAFKSSVSSIYLVKETDTSNAQIYKSFEDLPKNELPSPTLDLRDCYLDCYLEFLKNENKNTERSFSCKLDSYYITEQPLTQQVTDDCKSSINFTENFKELSIISDIAYNISETSINQIYNDAA